MQQLVYSTAGPSPGTRETRSSISLGSPEQQVHHLGRLAVAAAVLGAPPQLPPGHPGAAGTRQLRLPLLAVARR